MDMLFLWLLCWDLKNNLDILQKRVTFKTNSEGKYHQNGI